ncbi:MAG: endonuclease domain-containing protein [Acidobacteria bacterium]|nr:endonuclease domain-containing protein [Acidobacteriota bacterium]
MRYQRRGADRANERHLRRNLTDGEFVGWHVLRNGRAGVKFRRQHRIGPFIIDFYCSELRLGIEIDGAPHLTDEGKRYDESRTRALETMNIRIERFGNNWLIANPESFFAKVQALIEERRVEISQQRSVIIEFKR